LTTGKTKQRAGRSLGRAQKETKSHGALEKSSTAAARVNLAGKISEDETNSAERKITVEIQT
jgi:hypothetical protein